MRAHVCAIVVVSSVAGCFSHHAGTPLDLEPVASVGDRAPRGVIGVREPDPENVFEVARATSLIESLRATGLYREVNLERNLSRPPDVVVEAHENPRLPTCDGAATMLVIFLGVVPAWTTCDEGHYFSVVGDTSARFEFAWHVTELFGWIALPLNLLPGWSPPPQDAERRYDAFRGFMLAESDRLLPDGEP